VELQPCEVVVSTIERLRIMHQSFKHLINLRGATFARTGMIISLAPYN
jgi:hypothetical protein